MNPREAVEPSALRSVEGTARQEDWHAAPPEEVARRLGTTERGLGTSEAERRLARWGPNELPTVPPRPWLSILWAQFRSIVMALLAGAVAVSWLAGDPLEAGAIAAVMVINASIGFATEYRAREAIHALTKLQAGVASVVRQGEAVSVGAETLVPGDVVALQEGDRVPADIRLIEATGLRVNEAILTGESVPVVKDPLARLPLNIPIHDRSTMVHQGTAVVGGTALGIVTATGSHTAVGLIGRLLEATPDEETPLEQKLAALGHRLIGLTVAVAALVAGVGALRGIDWELTVKTGIALAVAAVPEGLPIIATIALAIGVRRMARRNALVRRLPSVETLGSVTVVGTDKTGTLTSGQMTGAETWTPQGAGEAPLIEAAALANRATVDPAGSEGAHSDPTEMALVALAQARGVDVAALCDRWPRAEEIPFSAARRLMAVEYRTDSGNRWYAKGAPESILELCQSVGDVAEHRTLTPAEKEQIVSTSSELAARGLRVLGFAASAEDAPGGSNLSSAEDSDRSTGDPVTARLRGANLRFLGLVGLIDPPAPKVKETIEAFRSAGIRVVMLTGDHKQTAAAVGRAVGIADGDVEAVDMSEWAATGGAPVEELARSATVLARVSPEQKLDVIDALQKSGEVVAMLGDGVNDAPALKRASVGVAMGRRGAEVARQAADILLEDDRFESVAAAIAEGRVVFANIRKFTFYLFSCNLAEVLVLLIAGLYGWPLPLLPIQILWLNVVTDTFPALALAFEPAEKGSMHQPPRPPHTPILTSHELRGIVVYAVAITIVTLAACYIGLQAEPNGGPRTMALTFATLALAQVFHLGNARGKGPVVAPGAALTNPFAIAGAAVAIGLLVMAMSIEWMRSVLGVSALVAQDWALVVALAALPALLGQAAKAIKSRRA